MDAPAPVGRAPSSEGPAPAISVSKHPLSPDPDPSPGLARGAIRTRSTKYSNGRGLHLEDSPKKGPRLDLPKSPTPTLLCFPLFRRTAIAGLRHDTKATLAAARSLHKRGGRDNLFIKIPGTVEGLPAIEESIFAGVPINVTLLFSREQYVASAEAYLRGVERRIDAGLNPAVASVASLFVSRWDVAVSGKVPSELTNRLGIAIARRTYKAYLELLTSPRFQRAFNAGARPQRLLWASTGTKDPKADDTLYVEALAAPLTINTMANPWAKTK